MTDIPEFNYKMSGGMFDRAIRVLPTFTLRVNEKTGCFIVHDDRQDGRVVSAGWKTLAQAVAAHQWEADKRTWS